MFVLWLFKKIGHQRGRFSKQKRRFLWLIKVKFWSKNLEPLLTGKGGQAYIIQCGKTKIVKIYKDFVHGGWEWTWLGNIPDRESTENKYMALNNLTFVPKTIQVIGFFRRKHFHSQFSLSKEDACYSLV